MTVEPEPLPEHLERLDADLRAALPLDDVPAAVLAAARGAWAWRLIDTELAELVEQERVVLRADQDLLVTFAAGDLFIDVDQVLVGGSELLIGQVTAPTEVESLALELVGEPAVVLPVDIDAGGGFQVAAPGIPARLVVHLADGRRVVTSWL